MVEYDFLIYESKKEITMYSGTSNQKIKIKGKEQDAKDVITVIVDGKSDDVLLRNGSVVVEGKQIVIKSANLPNGTVLALKFEPLGLMPFYEEMWHVQSGKEQKFYNGQTAQMILIHGPRNQQCENEKQKAKKESILISTQAWGDIKEPLISGSSTLVNASWATIKANETGDDAWSSGRYIFLK